MTEPTKKTTTGRAASSKKLIQSESLAVEVVKETPTASEQVAKNTRKKRIEINKNELIPCRSTVSGKLIYKTSEKEKVVWADYGSVQFLEMGELIRMKGYQPKFLNDILLVVDDTEAAEYLGLNTIYSELFELDDLNFLFSKSNGELEELLNKLPKGLQRTITAHARKLIEEGTLDSLSKIRLIEEKLGVDLQLFIK